MQMAEKASHKTRKEKKKTKNGSGFHGGGNN